MGSLTLLSLAAVLLAAVMAFAWGIARRPGLSGWTDVFWTFATGGAGVLVALVPQAGTLAARRHLVAALAALWAVRLGGHIAARTARHGEDPRYARLREEWGARFDARLFLFLQVQAAAALPLVGAILIAARNPAPALGWGDALGVAILLTAILGEHVSDRQLTRFRRDRANRAKVCDKGLWGLSRHPNYFFEWLGWTAYAVIAIAPCAHPATSWLALAAPLFIYALLVHVSGVPPLEAHMLASRGEAFRAYQRRVRAFWPIPKAMEPQ